MNLTARKYFAQHYYRHLIRTQFKGVAFRAIHWYTFMQLYTWTDGIKVNYQTFKEVLRLIKGLEKEEE